jgi:hypothetical protein
MRKFYLRVRIFLWMVFSYEGTGHFNWPWDAWWYAKHLEFWGIK